MKKHSEENTSKHFDLKKEIYEWVIIIIIAAAVAFILNTFIIANSTVGSGSMEQTLMTGDRVMGSRLSYRFGDRPKRGDIVIFYHKTEPGKDKTRLVKRIIGLPGETVDIRDNQVYIDQSELPLDESYLAEEMDTEDAHFEIPAGCYLMLGDNRNHSADARKWDDPYVPEKDIAAKVLFRYYPWFGKVG